MRLSIGGGFVEDTFVDIDRSFVFAVAAKMIGPLVKIRDFFIRLTGDGLHSSAVSAFRRCTVTQLVKDAAASFAVNKIHNSVQYSLFYV